MRRLVRWFSRSGKSRRRGRYATGGYIPNRRTGGDEIPAFLSSGCNGPHGHHAQVFWHDDEDEDL